MEWCSKYTTFFHMQQDKLTETKYAGILPLLLPLYIQKRNLGMCSRGRIEGLWEGYGKGVWHPLCQKSLFTVPAWVCILLPQSDHCTLKPAADSALFFSLQPSLPHPTEHPRAPPASQGGSSWVQGDSRLPLPCPALFGDSPIWFGGQTLCVGSS